MNPQKNAEYEEIAQNGDGKWGESRRIVGDIFLFDGKDRTEIIASRTVYRHDAEDKTFVALSRMQKRECAFLTSYLYARDAEPGICRADRQAVFLCGAGIPSAGLCMGILIPVRVASFSEIISAVAEFPYDSMQLSSAAKHGFRKQVLPPPKQTHVNLVENLLAFLDAYADTDFAYSPAIRGSLSATAYLRKTLAFIARSVDVLLVDRSDIPSGTRIFTQDILQTRCIDFSLLKTFSTALMMYLRDQLKNKTLEMMLSVQDGLLCISFSGRLLRNVPACTPEKQSFFRYFSDVADRLRAQLSVRVSSRNLSVTLVPYRYNPAIVGELNANPEDILFPD